MSAPIACYTCICFRPFKDAPHEKILDFLLEERDRYLKKENKTIAVIEDRTIVAVAEVLRLLEQFVVWLGNAIACGISDWFETGSEGSFWIIEQNGLSGMEGVHFIKKDDHLKITSASGQVVFEGVIEPDSTVNHAGELIYRNQPTSCGRWIHWYQKGVDPDLWGSYFFTESYFGVLEQKIKKQ